MNQRLNFSICIAIGMHALFFLGLQSVSTGQKPLLRPITKTLSVSLSQRSVVKPQQKVPQQTVQKQQVVQEKPEPKKPKPIVKKLKTEPVVKQAVQPQEEVVEPRQLETPKAVQEDTRESRVQQATVLQAQPLYHLNPPPEYPTIARRRRYQGTVRLDVLVLANGRVGDVRVEQSSGYRVLDNAALRTVRKWSFEPGTRGEKTVAMRVQIPVRFELK